MTLDELKLIKKICYFTSPSAVLTLTEINMSKDIVDREINLKVTDYVKGERAE